MIPGVRGRLISAAFARDLLPALSGFTPMPPVVATTLAAWSARVDATLGTTSSVRTVADVALAPLIQLLGFTCVERRDVDDASVCRLSGSGSTMLTAVVTGWGHPLNRDWRRTVMCAIVDEARWCVCCNGRELRIVDARRTWSREYLEFDLIQLAREREAQGMLWSLLRADAIAGPSPLLDRAVELSERHGVEVCQALGTGVLDALDVLMTAMSAPRRQRASSILFEQSLTVLYRVLFLLFAEARGLVPMWNPIYRDRYSLDAIVATLLTGRGYRGLWRAIRAISRLAHTGCSVGELHVTPFNGRLFAPMQADAFDRTRVSDAAMSRAVMAVSTAPVNRHGRRARIVYRDLDVEQLGAVYERVLEYEPAVSGDSRLERTRELRKASGTFYTPRAVTAFLVRRTLEPLVRGRRADEILALRLLDPAMGSGAFLVAACRYLSAAAEDALIGEGRWHPHEITPADRAALRREIASRCLFGVDLNPMAVQVARLSLWLATLAADKPLSFLDHHLVAGNSLVGASPDDIGRHPGGGSSRQRRDGDLPLFDRAGLTSAVEHAVRLRLHVASEPDDTAAIVRAKEQRLATLQSDGSSLRAWWRVLDLWCAGWFGHGRGAPDRGVFRELVSQLLTGRSALPTHIASTLLASGDEVAARHRFVHWPLAFPEVFAHPSGEPRGDAGFDAIIGNPPWEMVRGDGSGDRTRREQRRLDAQQLTSFVRASGIYHVDARAHANLYHWFIERTLQLLRPGGRLGLVLPAGVASDTGAAPLRRYVFDRADIDSLTGLDNREAIFPIHRSVRFVLMTATNGSPTSSIECRYGVTRAEELDRNEPAPDRAAIALTRAFLSRLSGDDDLGIPDLQSTRDLEIVERISATIPRLAHADGWQVQFGRELNASDDRHFFGAYTGAPDARPVVEGKQIEPFRVSLDACRFQLRRDAAPRIGVPRRIRLAYRDVASATNRLTLIAALVPSRAVTTHTLFCLKTSRSLGEQQVLCALLNSFVANYLVRMRVNTHVTVALVSRLPVPVVREGDPLFDRLRALSDSLTRSTRPVESMDEYAELQALVASAYGLDEEDFKHVLKTFPLIAESTREACLGELKILNV